jgi:hypothetical protein
MAAKHTESTPQTIQYRVPRVEDASESQSSKRRKAEDFTETSTHVALVENVPHPRTNKEKEVMLGIEMIGQMQMGSSMDKA